MVVVGVGMVDLLCGVAGSVPAGGCEPSVRARQRGGRPHPPNRGRTAEFGQRNLGVSRASRSVEAHRRLRGRTAPGLLEGSPGAGVAGESVIARHPTPLNIAGHRWAGGNVERGGGGAWISFGRGDGSHREQADPGRIWTSVLAVLCVAGGRARAFTRRTWGSGPKINKRSSRTLGARSRGAGVGTRVMTYEPAAEGRSATNLLGPTAAHDHSPRTQEAANGPATSGIHFRHGCPRPVGSAPKDRYETSIPPRSQGVFEGSFSPRCPGQRVDSATSPILCPVPGRRIASGPGSKTPGYRWAP